MGTIRPRLFRVAALVVTSDVRRLVVRLSKSFPGILLWAIEGWKRLQARKRFTAPKSSETVARALDDLNSSIGRFISERCIVEPEATVPKAEIYSAWKSWCEESGHDPQQRAKTSPSDPAVTNFAGLSPSPIAMKWTFPQLILDCSVPRISMPNSDCFVSTTKQCSTPSFTISTAQSGS